MVQKKLLILIAAVLFTSMLFDFYKSKLQKQDTIYKMDYLNSLHPNEEIATRTAFIMEATRWRKSYEIYKEKLESVQPLINYEDSIVWPQLVDEDDLEYFEKEILKIPNGNNNYKGLQRIRNKLIFSTYIDYLKAKLRSGTVLISFSTFIIKDLEDNLTLTNKRHDRETNTYFSWDSHTSREIEILSINNHIEFGKSGKEITIPLSDTLEIAIQSHSKGGHYFLPHSDTLFQSFFMNVEKIPNGSVY